jgi:hypothetical protein
MSGRLQYQPHPALPDLASGHPIRRKRRHPHHRGRNDRQLPGWITSSGNVDGPSVQAANTDYVAVIEGVIRVSIAGNLQLVFGSETSGQSVTIRLGTVGRLLIAA